MFGEAAATEFQRVKKAYENFITPAVQYTSVKGNKMAYKKHGSSTNNFGDR